MQNQWQSKGKNIIFALHLYNLMNPLPAVIIVLVSSAWGWLIGRFACWILFNPEKSVRIAGIRMQGLIPAAKDKMAFSAGKAIQEAISRPGFLEDAADSKNFMAGIRPDMEAHVDHFIKVKLDEHFPLLAKFMGEKTLGKLKEAFLGEVETLLPDLIKKHGSNLLGKIASAEMIGEKISAIPLAVLEEQVKSSGIFNKIIWTATFAGAVLGLIQLLLFLLL